MKRKSVRKVLVNGTAYLFSVVLLLSMVAAPVIASVSANSVGTYHIKDNSILNKDIRPNKISSSRIKNNTILNRDIHANVISSSRIRNGTIANADISGSAAISDSKISYSTKTGHLSIPVAELSPAREYYDYYKVNSLYMDTGLGWFYAPVQLPQGAVITKLRYNAYDNTGSYYTSTWLYEISNSNPNHSNEMAKLTTQSTANSSSWRPLSTTTISYATIDNKNYAYALAVYLGGPGSLYAGNIVIEYTYTTPGG